MEGCRGNRQGQALRRQWKRLSFFTYSSTFTSADIQIDLCLALIWAGPVVNGHWVTTVIAK
jgi:hypothetical protein